MDAVNSAARAFYFEEHFDEWAKYSQREYVDTKFSKSMQNTALSVYSIVKMISDKYVGVTWRFP
jgi:hypothetical protein